MGFLNSLKGKFHGDDHKDDLNSQQYQSPEIIYDSHTTKREKQQVFGTSDATSSSQGYETYHPPQGPPPSHTDSFAPPSGPPPGHQEANPPPYQDWLQVPDNSQLPPPPAVRSELSPTNNATDDSAEAGHRWCYSNPVYIPVQPGSAVYESVNKGNMTMEVPRNFRGSFKSGPSHAQYAGYGPTSAAYTIKSPRKADDACIIGTLPLYFAAADNPILKGSPTPKSVSFGVRILNIDDPRAVVGVGFAAKPYPPFRQPGWHRCSLAVHADDGRRYINDDGGGLDFVHPFQNGDVIKITMTFYPEYSPASENTNAETRVHVSDYPKCRTRVDFERNGHLEAGWDVHEERDAEHPGIDGLQGEGDLYAAVGACGACQFELLFWPQSGI